MSTAPAAPTEPGGSEVEVKLLADSPAALRRIAARERLGRFRLQSRGAARLRTIYLDTAQRTLLDNTVALRLRRHGRAWEATAKWAGRVRGDVHTRREINVPLPAAPRFPFALPPGALRDELFAYVLDRPLQPLLTTQIHRRLFDLVDDRGAVAAELALDTVRHGRGSDALSAPYYEVEIEQRGASLEELGALASLLRAEHGLSPTAETKFARAQRDVLGAAARRSAAPIDRSDTWLGAARKVAAAQLARLRANDPRVRCGADPDPEAIHQMRVATRRLRTMCQLFAAGMAETMRIPLAAELEWLGTALGAARDVDVQLAQWEVGTGAPADAVVTAFRRDLAAARPAALAELRAALASPRYSRLLRRLERFAAPALAPPRRPTIGSAPAEDVATGAAAALVAAHGALRKQAKRANRQFGAPAFHKLRIRCRRLRYLLEFLSPLLGADADWLIARLTLFQDLLGEANDRVLLARRLRQRALAALPEAQCAALHEKADEFLLAAGALHQQARTRWSDDASRVRKRVRRIARALALPSEDSTASARG